MENEIFKKRTGTTSRGNEYEDVVISRLGVNLILDKTIKNFKLSSNDENYGSFDDVVLEVENTNGGKELKALQLKHVNREKLLTKNSLEEKRGNFSLTKYFEDYKKLKEKDIFAQFFLFTNLKFNVPNGEKIKLSDDNIDITIKSVLPDPLLNTFPEGRCYKFETVQEEYQHFFKSFALYTNQANVDLLKMHLLEIFKSVFSSGRISLKEYLGFISEWSTREGRKPKLDLKMVKNVVTLCLLSQRIVPFYFLEEGCVDFKSKLLREALFEFKTVSFKDKCVEKVKQLYYDAQQVLTNSENLNKVGMNYQVLSKDIESFAKLSDKEKTKLLWLLDEFPLIVEENIMIREALRLCEDKRFIILSDQETNIKKTLSDLKPNSNIYEKIIDNFECSLQGKTKIKLKLLINEDEDFPYIISVNKLLQMVEDSFTIGGPEEVLSVPYVPRRVSINTINLKFLDDFEEDTLVVISCHEHFATLQDHLVHHRIKKVSKIESSRKEYFEPLKKIVSEDLPFSEMKTIYVSDNQCSSDQFETLCARNSKKEKFHHLKFAGGKLQWIESKGAMDDLDKYRVFDDYVEESELYFSSHNRIEVICADPGMGKSVLMKSIKNHQPSTSWAVLILSKEHSAYFKTQNQDANAFLKYLTKETKKLLSTFDSKVLEVLIRKRKIVLIWDGLDEISEQHLNTILAIMKNIFKKKFSQIVTSKASLKKYLEDELNVFARTIKQFDEQEQQNYIIKRLTLEENNEVIRKITGFVEIMHINNILGVPLHSYMLTELFLQDWEKYNNILSNSFPFSITDLYHYFVDEKFNIYFKEKAKLDFTDDTIQNVIITSKKNRLHNYEQISLNLVFTKRERTVHNDFVEEIQKNGDCFGILLSVTNEEVPIFIHQSFGEYFVASYLVTNHQNFENIKNHLFTEKFRNIRFFFDLLLAKDRPAHIAVLYKNFEMLMRFKDQIQVSDRGGRNPFHLACSWGNKYHQFKAQEVGLFKVKYKKSQKMSNIELTEYRKLLKFLSMNCMPYQIDHYFQMDVFAYANKTSSLYPMILLAKSFKRKMREFDNFGDLYSVIIQAIRLDYTEIFDITDLREIVRKQSYEFTRQTLNWNSTSVLKRMLTDKIYYKQLQNRALPVHVACQRCNLDVLQLLIRAKIDLNCLDSNGYTPLFLACKHNHLDIVKLLVKHKANINAPVSSSLTPIFAACGNTDLAVFEFLLEMGADIAAKTNTRCTPLHATSVNGSVQKARILLEKGADINARTTCLSTPLLLACAYDRTKVVGLLLDNGADVNASNHLGASPLHVACSRGSTQIVRLLVAVRADIEAVTSSNVRPIHMACNKGHNKVVQILVNAGAEVNCVNTNRISPLYVACSKGDVELVKILLKAGADPNIRTLLGRNALQVAVSKKFPDIVQVLTTKNSNRM